MPNVTLSIVIAAADVEDGIAWVESRHGPLNGADPKDHAEAYLSEFVANEIYQFRKSKPQNVSFPTVTPA